MSSKPIIVALVVLILLAAGVVFTSVIQQSGAGGESGPTVTAGVAMMELDASAVVGLSLSVEGRAPEVLTRGSDGTLWTLAGDGAGGASVAYRADFLRVKALLRELSLARTVGKPEAGATIAPVPPPTVLELRMSDGRTRTLVFAARTLGGQGRVEIRDSAAGAGQSPTRLAIVPAELVAAVTDAAGKWRDDQLFAGVRETASRVRAAVGGVEVALGKVGGRWAVTSPVSAPADAGAVGRLLSAIDALRAERFPSPVPSDEQAGLTSPQGRIEIESDVRTIGADAKVSVSTRAQTLVIGGPADAGGANLYARVDNQPVVIVRGVAIAGVDFSPANLVSPHASGVSRADIARVRVESSGRAEPGVWVKGASGWASVRSDGQEILLDKPAQQEVESLLEALTGTPGAVSLVPPEGCAATGTITIGRSASEPLDTLEIGVSEKAPLVVRSGRVWRVYAEVPALLRR